MCALELCRLEHGEQAASARGRGTEGPGGGCGLSHLLGEQGRALQSQGAQVRAQEQLSARPRL